MDAIIMILIGVYLTVIGKNKENDYVEITIMQNPDLYHNEDAFMRLHNNVMESGGIGDIRQDDSIDKSSDNSINNSTNV